MKSLPFIRPSRAFFNPFAVPLWTGLSTQTFGRSRTTKDAPANACLNQDQCEAFVDVLVLAMCIDDYFSLNEEEALEKEISALGWNPLISPGSYRQLSFARARDVVHSPLRLEDYLRRRADKLNSIAAKNLVLERTFCWLTCQGMNREEGAFMALLHRVFGL